MRSRNIPTRYILQAFEQQLYQLPQNLMAQDKHDPEASACRIDSLSISLSPLASIAAMISLSGIGIIAYSKSDRMDVKLPVLG